ncbi:MAG: hypothetical protein CML06_16355 [Pseudomonadales bacterium]|nr:hypothetical protein [Pseudomonadales bacterium]
MTLSMAEAATIQLEAACDISKAETFHERLETYLNSGSAVRIDASLVERVDTSILQTLACLIATMEKQHLQVTIIKPSAALIKAASLLGLSRHLGLAQQSDSNGEN